MEWDKDHFDQQGFAMLGHVLHYIDLNILKSVIDGVMLGQYAELPLRYQLDPDAPDYDPHAEQETEGHKGRSLGYRKITGLEHVTAFNNFIKHPFIKEVVHDCLNPPVTLFRAMFMNKPANAGTLLPWHQEVGHAWGLDTNRIVSVWTALDDCTLENGCLEVVPASHLHGIINKHHFASITDEIQYKLNSRGIPLQMKAGESVLLHNLLMHRSGINHTDKPRRAFSACYTEEAKLNGNPLPRVW